MAIALKLSNIHLNKDELVKRLRGVQSPGKKVLMDALKQDSYWAVYYELLYRIELYAQAKVLNYTRKDLNSIVMSSKKIGLDKVIDALFKQNFPVSQNVPVVQQQAIQAVIEENNLDDIIQQVRNENPYDYLVDNSGAWDNLTDDIRDKWLGKKEIETKRAKALLEPNEKNVYEYIKTQELWTDQAEKFSKTWQWVISKHPELNYSLRFPTSELAKQVKQKENSHVINMAISDIAQNYGIFYFYKSNCPYCERFSPILRTFGDRYKIKVLAISLDGKATKGFNIFKSDNGIAEKWGITQVPAIYAVSPLQDEVIPIAFGLISGSELEQRFLLFYENLKGREHATLRTVNH